MILLQLSAGQGPLECCQAVGHALKHIEKECAESRVNLEPMEMVTTSQRHCYKSVLLRLGASPHRNSAHEREAKKLAQRWSGTMLWVCESHLRPKHKRKNWFFSGSVFEIDEPAFNRQVSFKTCRASGAGGQHVNTTDSAVQAIHNETGISVRVENERSQHANKRRALALLYQKLDELRTESRSVSEKARWQQHTALERGNPTRVFRGIKFIEVRG